LFIGQIVFSIDLVKIFMHALSTNIQK